MAKIDRYQPKAKSNKYKLYVSNVLYMINNSQTK